MTTDRRFIVPDVVVVKENYEYDFSIENGLPKTKYVSRPGSMVVYGGDEYPVKESPEEVVRKVLEWKLTQIRYHACWVSQLFGAEKYEKNLFQLAGLEDKS